MRCAARTFRTAHSSGCHLSACHLTQTQTTPRPTIDQPGSTRARTLPNNSHSPPAQDYVRCLFRKTRSAMWPSACQHARTHSTHFMTTPFVVVDGGDGGDGGEGKTGGCVSRAERARRSLSLSIALVDALHGQPTMRIMLSRCYMDGPTMSGVYTRVQYREFIYEHKYIYTCIHSRCIRMYCRKVS